MKRVDFLSAGLMMPLLLAGLMQGCGLGRMITIDSEPQGAVVKANDRPIGQTPLKIAPDEVFPPRWHGTLYAVQGTLGLERAGCRPYSREVDDLVLSRDIKVMLDCSAGASMTTGKPAAPEVRPGPAPRAGKRGIEQRLRELKRLHEQGLITDQDYNGQRQRILNEL